MSGDLDRCEHYKTAWPSHTNRNRFVPRETRPAHNSNHEFCQTSPETFIVSKERTYQLRISDYSPIQLFTKLYKMGFGSSNDSRSIVNNAADTNEQTSWRQIKKSTIESYHDLISYYFLLFANFHSILSIVCSFFFFTKGWVTASIFTSPGLCWVFWIDSLDSSFDHQFLQALFVFLRNFSESCCYDWYPGDFPVSRLLQHPSKV